MTPLIMRLLSPPSIIIALLIFRFIFVQIPKLKFIVRNTNYKIPINEFRIYTKLYVITSISGMFSIACSQKMAWTQFPGVDTVLIAVYTALYGIFVLGIVKSQYFNKIWKSRNAMYVAYFVSSVCVAISVYNKLVEVGFQIAAVTLSLVNWFPILSFFSGLVAVKENALAYKTTKGIDKYQPTHEFLQYTEKQTNLSGELLEDYKRCDFYNFAFYCAFMFMITESSYNRSGTELLYLHMFGLAMYAVINAYLYNWYGTSFDDFRIVDKNLAELTSSVELIIGD